MPVRYEGCLRYTEATADPCCLALTSCSKQLRPCVIAKAIPLTTGLKPTNNQIVDSPSLLTLTDADFQFAAKAEAAAAAAAAKAKATTRDAAVTITTATEQQQQQRSAAKSVGVLSSEQVPPSSPAQSCPNQPSMDVDGAGAEGANTADAAVIWLSAAPGFAQQGQQQPPLHFTALPPRRTRRLGKHHQQQQQPALSARSSSTPANAGSVPVPVAKVKAACGKQRLGMRLPCGVAVGPKRPWSAALGADSADSHVVQRVCRPSTPPPRTEQPAVPNPLPPLSAAAVQAAAPVAALAASSTLWQAQHLDIVALTDTHVGFPQRTALQQQLMMHGWQSYWCLGYEGGGQIRAGVAIAVRSALLSSAVLKLRGTPQPAANAGPQQGRLLHLPLQWGRQPWDVVVVYLHASDHATNVTIINGPLQQLCAAACPTGLVLLGDFNFVHSNALDRRSPTNAASQQQHPQQQQHSQQQQQHQQPQQPLPPQQQQLQQQPQHPLPRDTATAAAWAASLPFLEDAWRAHRPRRRAFTYVHTTSASRIDRAYVPVSMLPQVARCCHLDQLPLVSDHVPVLLQLLSRHPGQFGPGIARLRLSFLDCPVARDAMQAWLTAQQPPSDPTALVDNWWPAFKAGLVSQVQHLNHQRQQQQQQNTQAAVQRAAAAAAVQRAAAAAAVHAGHQQLAACDQPAVPAALDALVTARLAFATIQASELLAMDGVDGVANIVASRYATVTAAAQVQPQAQQQVLQALYQYSTPLPPQDAAALGATEVTEAEVAAAIAALALGKAPGLDGIPGELFRRFKQTFARILSRLKAYDTVDREFLCSVATTLGVGAGFVSWMRLLMTNTYSCALVNAAQYADDVEPVLPNLQVVDTFVSNMLVFGAASGQHLQPAKCSLLPVGAVPPAMSTLPQQSGLRITTHARSLGVDFDSTGVLGLDWQQRMQQVRQRLQKITRIPRLSAFGRAFAVNAYALSCCAQYACAIPTEHALLLMKWSAAVVDAGLGPDDDLRRPPGIPTACMAAHPRQGGFGLLPLREHMFSRWACEAARLLVDADATPWIAIGRALLTRLLGLVPGGGVWSLALCDRAHLFSGTAVLPLVNPLRALAVGLRALPPLQYVGDEDALPTGSWCWHAPLWSNPFLVRTQTWQWFGMQREVVVGLECEAPAGLLRLPALQTVGQAVCLLINLQLIDQLPGGLPARRTAYQRDVWGPVLMDYPPYADRFLALAHVRQLLSWVPSPWLTAAVAVYNAAQAAGSHPPACTVDSIADARQHLSAHLG
eukprot:gene15309-biopygen4070